VSAVGNAHPAAGATPADEAQAPGFWGSFGTGLRLLVGWCSVAVALLNLLAELDRVPDPAYLVFHALLLIGGLLLIMLGALGAGTGPVGALAGGLVLSAGMLVSALPVNDAVCCLTGYAERHGYPFSFVARQDGGSWHVDSQHLLIDLAFWGYAGLITLVLVAVTRRIIPHRDGTGKGAGGDDAPSTPHRDGTGK
jgi:hypothetical protein